MTAPSRAALLLQRELAELAKSPLYGIQVQAYNWNVFEWRGILGGLKDTMWQEARFEIEILFTDDYSNTPPTIRFMTIPLHPNIDMETGQVSLTVLRDEAGGFWTPKSHTAQLLLALQCLLEDPNFDETPINPLAAATYQQAPAVYRQLVEDCVTASHRISVVENDWLPDPVQQFQMQMDAINTLSHPPVSLMASKKSTKRTIKKMSLLFEEYHAQWQRMATTTDILLQRKSTPTSTVVSQWMKSQAVLTGNSYSPTPPSIAVISVPDIVPVLSTSPSEKEAPTSHRSRRFSTTDYAPLQLQAPGIFSSMTHVPPRNVRSMTPSHRQTGRSSTSARYMNIERANDSNSNNLDLLQLILKDAPLRAPSRLSVHELPAYVTKNGVLVQKTVHDDKPVEESKTAEITNNNPTHNSNSSRNSSAGSDSVTRSLHSNASNDILSRRDEDDDALIEWTKQIPA